jgi:hypothetical protein
MIQPDVVWPAASTFGNILSRAGLTSPQKKRKRTMPCSEPFSMVTGPNQLRFSARSFRVWTSAKSEQSAKQPCGNTEF